MGAIITTPVTVALTLLSTRTSDLAFWFKWITSYVYIELFRRRTIRRFDLYDMEVDNDPYKVGFIPPPEEVALESPMPENQLLGTADEVFCYGVNSKSECLIIRVARGTNHEAEAWIHMKLSDGRVYQLKETSGFQQSCCDKRAFTCGDLQMHYLSPMRRWRIFFNGMLRELSDDNSTPEKMVHVKFALLWSASSDTFDFISDLNTKSLATGLAKAKWKQFLPPLEKLHAALNFYSQTGVILGSVSIEGNEEHDLYLFGEKMRILGDTSLGKGAEFFHVLCQTSKNGRFVHVVEASIANVVENLTFGFIVQPTGAICTITDTSIALENLSDEEGNDNDVEAKFHVDEQLYELQGKLVGDKAHFQSNKGWDGRLTIACLNFQLNSLKGSGVVIKGKIMKPSQRIVPKAPTLQTSSVVPLVLNFSDQMCQNPDITGGKGSSLGKLTELSKDFQNFVVPSGIVVTTAAYEKFLTKDVLREIKGLEDVLYNKKGGDVKAACEKVADEVIKSTIPDQVLQEVVTNIQKSFPDRKHTHKFAVRSSATGEDTEQMSAAGQMETYLGVSGLGEIMSAVKKCWASQFSYIAVQYKRQNGQIINSPMAVVIQQMISCDVAGVLFTCDPLTGSPNSMSITANYGLGESVVSGSEEPDTIEIGRYEDEKLVIKNKIIGSKSRRIVAKDDGGTNIEDVPEHEREACCLTDEMALRLGFLAAKIEKSYRSHRDIEWGFWNNNLYIFQSRPVTSGTGETDFEIEHEMDAPLRVENEYFTVCNVGEVMPGAMSPLGLEVLMKFFNIVFQRSSFVDWQQDVRSRYFPIGMCSMYNHVMFYCVDLFRRIGEDKSATEAGIIGMFGRLIDDEEILELAREKHGHNKRAGGFKENINRFRRLLYMSGQKLRKEQKAYAGYRIPIEKYETSQELFDALLFSCSDLCQAMGAHMVCSEASSIWNIVIFTILRKARGELDADVYGDFAQLLTTCSEVESADVPAAIEKLAARISKDIKPEDFKQMDINEAVRWLETSTTVSGIKYREFLFRHGHRCLKEFDIRSTTWGTNPNSLIKLLQNLVGSVKTERAEKTSGDFKSLISQLKIPLDFKARLLMRIILPLSRRAVQERESSKSLLIRGVDAWRNAYNRLAKLMVSEGRIPDQDLLFFMTLEDIKELLSSRSPKIISKANHRRRRHPTMDKYMFPEIMKGFPKPINMETDPIVTNDESFFMKGIPVSQGVTKGFVRVAITLEEASLLQPGEILLTYSTDIGWSPYFPILAGVVTELGGLISHGAVVSREYGLPCIAGLHGATRQFQTGDYVLLDGNKGILQKLSQPENQ